MQQRPLGQTGLEISPIVFGGNVFGWTIDEQQSFKVLDAFYEQGFNSIDTADFYSIWAPSNQGGESETIIGKWLKQHPERREQLVLFTKVGLDMGIPGHQGLSKRWITQAVEDSLKRLNTDYIDLYFAHWPDDNTPHEESLATFDQLRQQGKIRAYGCSNFSAQQIQDSIKAANHIGVQPYQVLQPEYNLYDRADFEHNYLSLCQQHQLGVVSYYSLASGFLSGKYKTLQDIEGSSRADGLKKYFDTRGLKILDALRQLADQHQAQPADIALAWILAQPSISAPIASATSVQQIERFAKAVDLTLTVTDLKLLNEI